MIKTKIFAATLCLFFVFLSHEGVSQKYVQFINKATGVSLAGAGATKTGDKLVLKKAVGDGGKWVIERDGSDVKIKNKKSGLYMAALGASKAGEPVKLTEKPGAGAIWTFNKVQKDGKEYVQIVNKKNGLGIATMGSKEDMSPAKFNTLGGQGALWQREVTSK